MKEETKVMLQARYDAAFKFFADRPMLRGFILGLLVGWLFL